MTDIHLSLLRIVAASDRSLTAREVATAAGMDPFRVGLPLAQLADVGLLLRHAGAKRRYEVTFRGRRWLVMAAPMVDAPVA